MRQHRKRPNAVEATNQSEYEAVARFVDVRLYYGTSSWLALAEVKFINGELNLFILQIKYIDRIKWNW